jgi:hypothetical protein
VIAATLGNYPPLRSPRKFDDVGVIVSPGDRLGHHVEGDCVKMAPKVLIVSQFSQTNTFHCDGGVPVLGGHGERSRLDGVRN